MLTELEHRPIRYLYEATLSNGTVIFVKTDGTAVDEYGGTYTAINEFDSYGDLVQLGWKEDN